MYPLHSQEKPQKDGALQQAGILFGSQNLTVVLSTPKHDTSVNTKKSLLQLLSTNYMTHNAGKCHEQQVKQ